MKKAGIAFLATSIGLALLVLAIVPSILLHGEQIEEQKRAEYYLEVQYNASVARAIAVDRLAKTLTGTGITKREISDLVALRIKQAYVSEDSFTDYNDTTAFLWKYPSSLALYLYSSVLVSHELLECRTPFCWFTRIGSTTASIIFNAAIIGLIVFSIRYIFRSVLNKALNIKYSLKKIKKEFIMKKIVRDLLILLVCCLIFCGVVVGGVFVSSSAHSLSTWSAFFYTISAAFGIGHLSDPPKPIEDKVVTVRFAFLTFLFHFVLLASFALLALGSYSLIRTVKELGNVEPSESQSRKRAMTKEKARKKAIKAIRSNHPQYEH